MSFTCPVPGCGKTFETERAFSGHMGGKHPNYRGQGAIVTDEGTSFEEAETMEANEDGFTVPVDMPVVDQGNVLRKILHLHNIIGNKREAIVKMFSYYPEDDADGLEEVLKKNAISKNVRDTVVELYKKEMGIVDKDDDEMQTPVKGRRNPLGASPTEFLDDPTGLAGWMRDMIKTKIMMDQMAKIFGPLGFGQQNDQTSVPQEIKRELEELRKFREEQQKQKEMEPLVRRINALQQALEEKEEEQPKRDPTADIMEMVKMKALLKSLGDDEGAMKLQVMMDQKAEQERLRREEEARQFQAKMELERQNNQNLQLQMLQNNFKAQTDMMNLQLQMAQQAKSRDVMDVLKEAKEISSAIAEFTGQNAEANAEAQKSQAVSQILQSVAQTLGPVASEIARSYGEGKRGASQAPPQRPSGPPLPDPGYKAMDCASCGTAFQYPEDASAVACPRCNARYDLATGDDGDRRSALMSTPMDELLSYASKFGIDGAVYGNDKERLVNDLLAVASAKGLDI